jgi:ribosome-associated protein
MRRRSIPGEPEPPSKGELKRRAHSVQELADRLVEAPESTLEALGLPEALYVAKLMRRIDVEPLRAALESRDAERRLEARRFQRAERWRDRIVAEGTAAVEELLHELPQLDAPAFRALAEEARLADGSGRPPRARRELFRALYAALAVS